MSYIKITIKIERNLRNLEKLDTLVIIINVFENPKNQNDDNILFRFLLQYIIL